MGKHAVWELIGHHVVQAVMKKNTNKASKTGQTIE
jgi:hypothetical protein